MIPPGRAGSCRARRGRWRRGARSSPRPPRSSPTRRTTRPRSRGSSSAARSPRARSTSTSSPRRASPSPWSTRWSCVCREIVDRAAPAASTPPDGGPGGPRGPGRPRRHHDARRAAAVLPGLRRPPPPRMALPVLGGGLPRPLHPGRRGGAPAARGRPRLLLPHGGRRRAPAPSSSPSASPGSPTSPSGCARTGSCCWAAPPTPAGWRAGSAEGGMGAVLGPHLLDGPAGRPQDGRKTGGGGWRASELRHL